MSYSAKESSTRLQFSLRRDADNFQCPVCLTLFSTSVGFPGLSGKKKKKNTTPTSPTRHAHLFWTRFCSSERDVTVDKTLSRWPAGHPMKSFPSVGHKIGSPRLQD